MANKITEPVSKEENTLKKAEVKPMAKTKNDTITIILHDTKGEKVPCHVIINGKLTYIEYNKPTKVKRNILRILDEAGYYYKLA